MKKTLGQTGLNFIANKYKELKELVGKKADKSEIKTKLSELTGDSTHRTVTDLEKTKLSNIEDGANKVTKISQLENDKNFKTAEEVKSIVTSDMESYFNKMPKIVLLSSDAYYRMHEHEKETIYVIK